MKCRYCGNSAGLFKREHRECKRAFEAGKQYIRACISSAYDNRNCANLKAVIANTAKQNHISPEALRPLLHECWIHKAQKALADGILSDDEISILYEMAAASGIDSGEIRKTEPGKIIQKQAGGKIRTSVINAMQTGNLSGIQEEVEAITQLYHLPENVTRAYIFSGWESYIDKALEDGIISEDEEYLLERIADIFGLEQSEAPEIWSKVFKGLILRDVMNGIARSRISPDIVPGVMLQPNEVLFWVEHNVARYEERIRREYTGGSAGMSIRIAQGVYLRTSAFKGYPVETPESVYIGDGCLCITSKNIYWVAVSKSIKIPVKKIVSVFPAGDGVIIQKDGVTAKPQYFVTNDPWFHYNLILNLNLVQ